ncbi:hypothetical protein BH11MYX1_BH11MYX1_49360 [soil metagenome]
MEGHAERHVPPRRPRTPNPKVDEAIQSGEIESPRSLIIRSSANPALAREEDRTEPTIHPAPSVPVKTRRFGRLAWLVAAIAPALAALVLQYAQPTKQVVSPHAGETNSITQLVAVTLDGEVHAAQLRVEAIASSSMLRAGIQTDAATLRDMAKDQDIVFSLGPGERAEVFQSGARGSVSLLRVPVNAVPIDTVVANQAVLEVQGSTASIVVSAPVKTAGVIAGIVALATPIDVSRMKGGHFEQLTGVTLTGLGQPLALGGGPAATGTAITAPVPTALKGAALAITATLAAPSTTNDHIMKSARYACAVLATLFLLMYLGSVILRR